MIRTHAKIVPWGITNQVRVDDKPENLFQGHNEVKGQMSAFSSQETYINQLITYYML